MIKKDNICGAILVGGRGTRLGKDKIYIKINGKPLYKIMYDKLALIFKNVYFIGRDIKGYKSYPDEIKIKAAITGIYTALKRAETDFCFITAVDLPLLEIEIIELLVKNTKPEYDIIVPFIKGFYEPLVAVYSVRLTNIIRQSIDKGELKINSLMGKGKTLKIGENIIKKFDSSFNSFLNINRKEDLEKIINMVNK